MSRPKRSVARVFPPGDFIREELEARGWTQRDLAEILGRPIQAVNSIVNGKKEITPETAVALARHSALRPSSGSTWNPPIVWPRSDRLTRLLRRGPDSGASRSPGST